MSVHQTKPRIGLQFKFIVFISGMLIVSTTIMIVVNVRSDTAMVQEILLNSTKSISSLLRESATNLIYNLQIQSLRILLADVLKGEDVIYAYAFDEEGRILSDGSYENKKRDEIRDDPISRRSIVATEQLIQYGKDFIDITEPIYLSDKKIGGVRLGYSLINMHQDIAFLRNRNVFLGIIFLLFGILGTVVLTKIIFWPISFLVQATEHVAQGHFDKRINISTRDELGILIDSFNRMMQDLNRLIKEENQLAIALAAAETEKRRSIELERINAELRKVNEELKQTQAQLFQSEKLASIGQLAAGVAHEINNPVGFINNNMEVLGQYIADYGKVLRMVENLKTAIEQENLEKAKSMVEEMTKFEEEINLDYIINDINNLLQHNQRGIERIQKIVMDLRTFAREDKDAIDLVKIEEIIDSILSIVHNELKYKAELKKSYGDTPLVRCNPQRLGQVFINLLVNAVQAIEEKGVIEIKTYRQGENICVDIIDTGKGIEEKNLRKIFDPFFTTKPIGHGTGLGLSVSYEIVKKHKGEIKVQSKVGEGTTFTVILPIT